MDEEEQSPGVRLHRAGDVADHDQLPVNPRARTEDAPERISTRPERLADRLPQVEPAAAVVAAEASRAALWPVGGDLRDQRADALELHGRHRREVLRTQDLVRAVPARLARLLVGLGVGVAALAEVRVPHDAGLVLLSRELERPECIAEEPRPERAVED